jgi:hypothetical protein
LATLAAVATALGTTLAIAEPAQAAPPAPAQPQSTGSCQLANGIRHVVRIMFDNVHLTRDDPQVPSDLEQMPALLDFVTQHGVMMANDHDVLVHTGTNFISNLTGLYPDRTAITQSNSFNDYGPDGKTHPGVSFAYWTDPIYDYTGANADTNYNLQYTADRSDVPNDSNVNVPAPWVPYTRAGCNVGEVGMANTVLENIATDIPTVFGAGSPQQAEATADPAKATADFVGYAVHCAATSTMCASGQTDALPDEPGGYDGFKALFGNAEVQPAISPSGPVTALNGTVITDGTGNVGFPGFDSLTPPNALGYGAQMLEHGVQVANIYLSDVHGDHTGAGLGDLGPGSELYEQQLADYNTAFAQFFARLARDGITPSNTLFVVTTDEGDHFSGSEPTPAGCTGLDGNYCHYAVRSEVNVNLTGLLASATGDTTPYAIHSDPAPALWVTGQPARTDPAVRQLARDIGGLQITNPLTGATEPVAYRMADPVEEKILHFVSSDPARTPTLTLFSGEDSYVGGGGACTGAGCVYTTGAGYAWNHGGYWPDMQDIWAGYVGPGISARGTNTSVWTDQVDTRPTLLALTGLTDDYVGDGRALLEICSPAALPASLRDHRTMLLSLGAAYKQILGAGASFALDTLAASTRALTGGSAIDDAGYTRIENQLIGLDGQRDRIADRIASALDAATFHGQPLNGRTGWSLLASARRLLASAHRLAQG